MRALVFLVLCVIAASADEASSRIMGGSITSIRNYPEMVALLHARNQANHRQFCGGMIITQRSILTAAHCFDDGRHVPAMWRMRVGSDYANSGGTVLVVAQMKIHPRYDRRNYDSDLAILRSTTNIRYGPGVQPATLASYNVADNQIVYATGWGRTEFGASSEQLRQVQIWTINQAVCRQRHPRITDNMLCSGWLNVGGRDQCDGDAGGPLYHNRYVVGVTSWGVYCADPYYPGVNVRVSRFVTWIRNNA
ncbi:trypsin, alkaline A-like [Anticarsia gemmatalis]|uniref:trypsin, alkaline A-like n=1 Tax=Anticarsia gemmatalis TaxID=129554 RepID=UPI003F7640A6